MSRPLVSVVLPVYNGGPFLRAGIESVLAQTYPHFELIVVDDGSTDDSREVVRSFDDPRIRLVEQGRGGLVAALNRGLDEARGELVARMDADDLSLPARLERQVARFADDASIGLVCTSFDVVDGDGVGVGRVLLPLDDSELRARMLLRNPFSHGAVMLRRAALDTVGRYSSAYGNNEDYDLWRRVARHYRLAALPEVLYVYREHDLGVSKVTAVQRLEDRERLRNELWKELAPSYRLGAVLDSVRRYRADGTPEGRARLVDILDDQWALAREALLRRRPWLAVRALLVAAVFRPRGVRRLLRRLRSLRG